MAKKDDTMKRRILLYAAGSLLVVGTALLLGACGELKSDLPAPGTQKGIHDIGWNDPASTAFHGNVLKQTQYDTETCVICHAKAFTGGTSGQSCFTCHESYPHKPGWADTTSAQSHGNYLRLNMGTLAGCAKCHGTDYAGGTSGTSCYTCHGSYPHKTGWAGAVPASSHGGYLAQTNWKLSECAGCHGKDFKGGTSGVSCFTCHASYPHANEFQLAGGHQFYLYQHGYPLAQCKTCHGATYDGGTVVSVSCMAAGCHVDAGGVKKSPEACNTCHGQFRAVASDRISPAPPKGVLGDSLATSRSVGAHREHLVSGTLGKDVKCVECHAVPAQTAAGGHIDTKLPAEVAFNDTLARLASSAGTFHPSPSYNATTQQCSNTYCHGNWKATKATAPVSYQYAYTDSVMMGANNSPVWTAGGVGAACSSCHSLPPTGHMTFPLASCVNCHQGVVNGSGDIIDKSKHINGKINAFNTERDF